MESTTERAVDHQYFVRAPVETVFGAITGNEWLTRWLCDRADLTLREGGAYVLGWNGGPTHTGKIVELLPGRRIAFAWSWPGVELQGTVLSLSVEAQGEGTLLRIRHTGFPRLEKWADLYGGAEWGWTYFAMNLKSVLEHGFDLRSGSDG